MKQVLTTQVFDAWFIGLRDARAKVRIQVRIDRAVLGNMGDCVPVGEGGGNAHPLWARVSRVFRAARA